MGDGGRRERGRGREDVGGRENGRVEGEGVRSRG